jgi:hypothetical protein
VARARRRRQSRDHEFGGEVLNAPARMRLRVWNTGVPGPVSTTLRRRMCVAIIGGVITYAMTGTTARE